VKVLVVGGDKDQKDGISTALGPGNGAELFVVFSDTVLAARSAVSGQDGEAGRAGQGKYAGADDLSEFEIDGNGSSPDIVLLDCRLTGEDSLARLMGMWPEVPILVFSPPGTELDAVSLVKSGAADVLSGHDWSSSELRRRVLCASQRSQRSTELLKQINDFAMAQMQGGLVAIDSSGLILNWSAGMERMLAVSADEAAGKKLSELLPCVKDDQKVMNEAMSGRTTCGAMHKMYVEGRSFHARFQFTYSPLRLDSQVAGLICFMREGDLTSDLQHMGAVMQQRLRMLSDAMVGLVWFCDHNGDRFLFNTNWLEFTGRDIVQQRGRGWLECVHRQDVRFVWSEFSRAIAKQERYHMQYRLRGSDNQYRLVLESGYPQFSSDGVFIGMMGTCDDVSNTDSAQHSIVTDSEPDASFTSTLALAPLAIWRLDKTLTVRRTNQAVLSLLHAPNEEIVGKPLTAVIPSLDVAMFEEVLNGGQRVRFDECKLSVNYPDGVKQVIWDIVAWPLKNEEDEITGVCISTSDMSERKQASQQRDNFVASLVHDLKTPLIGADRTLEQMINGALGDMDPGQAEVLGMLRRSNQQLLQMVQNLIEVYRYEAGQPTLTIEVTELCGLIKVAIAELKALAAHRGIDLTGRLPASAYVRADRLALRRVFLNLIDNAIKFTPRGGSITIACDRMAESVVVHVTDTGSGISAAEQPKLFQQFSQGSRSNRYAPGTGLGLYLCRHIVTAHKGTISLDSQEGHGTTVSIRLPLDVQTHSSLPG